MKIEEIDGNGIEIPFVKLIVTKEEFLAIRKFIGRTNYDRRLRAVTGCELSWTQQEENALVHVFNVLDNYSKGDK